MPPVDAITSKPAAPRALTGQCLCGAVRYEVLDEFEYALNCHCSNCRRATGAAYKPFAGIARAKLRITEGSDCLLLFGEALSGARSADEKALSGARSADEKALSGARSADQKALSGARSADPTVAHDVRCAKCGSLLYSVVREGTFVHVTLGTLVDAPTIRPGAHIFVGSKAPWHSITDDLPQNEEF